MSIIRADIQIRGIVQGVGFRPFIHRLANEAGLKGWIRNNNLGAELQLEGEIGKIQSFIADVKCKAPVLAQVESVDVNYHDEILGFSTFAILPSASKGARRVLISPDVAVCEDCLREMRDPSDRRYGYPFINCTNCGPRFSIIRDVPYDRKNTTMIDFPMCGRCEEEYGDIYNRRYHAQPDCCSACGPRLMFLDGEGNEITGEDAGTDSANRYAIRQAIQKLRDGAIVAVKGLGGFHLACRGDDERIAERLRKRKHRDEKPFALMCRDVETAERYADVSQEEARALKGFRRPIVLLKKRSVSDYHYLSENGYVGIILPYTPVHYLLLGGELDSLIMTSANLSDLPIIYKNEQAVRELSGIADYFLMNNRRIETRCDDSLQWIVDGNPYHVRRSRGYVPYPLTLEGADGILACGAEQKASFALANDGYVFPSQHIGDLKNMETFENYEGQIKHFERLFDADVRTVVCDLHPDYFSTDYAVNRAEKEHLEILRVQHHHAHMASCMADNRLEGDCIGIIWDGTGLGTDGTIWGSEFLVGGYREFTRAGSFKGIRLPGGDRAAKDIWKIAVSLLEDSGIDSGKYFPGGSSRTEKSEDQIDETIGNRVMTANGRHNDRGALNMEADQIRKLLELDINCPVSYGMGRLFDGVSALIGIRDVASYEGQGAVLLEAAAEAETFSSPEDGNRIYRYEILRNQRLIIDTDMLVRDICLDMDRGVSRGRIAAAFMNTLIAAAIEMCELIRDEHDRREADSSAGNGNSDSMSCSKLNRVVLSGGSFQNMYMLTRLMNGLKEKGFEVYKHSRVSCNDEGISFGQAAIAARMK